MSPTVKKGLKFGIVFVLQVYLNDIFFIGLGAIKKWNPLSQKAETLCRKKFTKNDVISRGIF
jgi:hypothetical protein